MAVDKTPSQVATSALQAIPFGSIIGGPLKACVEAQALAAKTTWEFIQNVGINVNPETGEKTAVNVSFSFIPFFFSIIDSFPHMSMWRHCNNQWFPVNMIPSISCQITCILSPKLCTWSKKVCICADLIFYSFSFMLYLY